MTLPQQPPFLFLDSAEVDGDVIRAQYTIKGDEYFLEGHFKGDPIFPASLVFEGMGQAATLLIRRNIPKHEENDVLAYKLKEVKFMAPILPNSQVRFEIDLIAQDERGAILQGKAFVKEDVVADALLMLAIVNKNEFRAKYAK